MLGHGSETVCINKDRSGLSRFQEIYVGANVFNFGKGAFWIFSKSFRFTNKTATALCWGTVAKHYCGNRDRTSLSRFQEIYVGANVLNFGKGAFWIFSKSVKFTSKTATALCWGTVAKHFAVIETERALVVFKKFYVGANVLNFGKGAFWIFSNSFRFTRKTATALCWGTASKQFAVSETDRALVVFKKFMLVPMWSILDKKHFEFFLSLLGFPAKLLLRYVGAR